MLTRRHVLASTLAAPAILRFGIGTAQAATTLKISHQFPGGTVDKGDFRDRLCYPSPENFSAKGLVQAAPGFAIPGVETSWSVFFRSNLSASVHRNTPNVASSSASNYQTRENSGIDRLI